MLDPLKPDWAAVLPVRDLYDAEPGPHGVRYQSAAGPIEIALFAPWIVRLRLGLNGKPDYGLVMADPSPPDCRIDLLETGARLSHDGLLVELADPPLNITIAAAGTARIRPPGDGHFRRRFRLPPISRTPEGWFIAIDLEDGEPVYGLGEKWGGLDHRGQMVNSWVEDALGVNAEKSYKNCPFAWSPSGWGVFVATSAHVRHAVGYPTWSHRTYAIEVADDAVEVFLLLGTPAEIIERYTWLTGRPPEIPRWSFGAWLSKAYYRDSDELLQAARKVRELELPMDVITLDGRAWLETSTRFAFEWDASRYPAPREITAAIEALGLRLCNWEYPLVSIHHPHFEMMAEKGWLLRDARSGAALRHNWESSPFGTVLTPLPTSGLVDFTHPDAYAFWRDSHRRLFDDGVAVMKTDFGEQVPAYALAHNGDSGDRLHNVYPLLYNRCVFEAAERYGKHGALVFARSGWAGSQRYPTQWGGDPQSDWGALAASIRGMLSWANSGVGGYATDIGGFYGEQPSAELYVRWAQAAVFAPHMRFHGIGAREPWSFGDDMLGLVRDALTLRYSLIPYIQEGWTESTRTGLPLCRAMALAFPDQPESWAFERQYMFGADLLVAPVTRPDGKVGVWLPQGRWHDFRTREAYEGGRYFEKTCALEDYPVFARSGSSIGLASPVQKTDDWPDAMPIGEVRSFRE